MLLSLTVLIIALLLYVLCKDGLINTLLRIHNGMETHHSCLVAPWSVTWLAVMVPQSNGSSEYM